MLKAVELPASVPNLAAGLAHVHADTFPLGTGKYVKWIYVNARKYMFNSEEIQTLEI